MTVALVSAATALLGLVPLAARAADSGRTAEGLEEVVVTAQKRSETLITVPASVTALQGADLENQGVTSFSDYMTLVPGLTNNSGGAPGMGLTILRGLNTGNGQLTSTVGNYVDDVAVSGNGSMSFGIFMTPDPDIGDVDHIEVLKGPQATLYGANTLGGLIKIVTNKPDVTKNSGSVRLEASSLKGDNGYSVSGVANFVLDSNSTFAIRVSGFKRETPGYLKNVTLGTKHLGGSDSRGGRVALRWVPNDKFDATLTASLQNTDVTGWTYEYVDMNTLKPAYGDNTYATLFDPYTRNKYRTFSLAINYQADAGTLTSSTSYAKVSSVQLQDWTDYLGPLNDFCFLAPTYETPCGPPPAGTAFAVIQDPSIKKFTQELRFATKRFGAWEGIGGLFFTDEDTAVHMPLANWNSATMQQQVEPWGNVYAADSKSRYREWAAFADSTFYFTDAFDLTIGGRYSDIRQKFNTCSSGWLTFSDPYCQPNKVNDDSFTYLGVLRWRITPDVNTYARVATSFRPGGAQGLPAPGETTTFKPDKITSYEVGIKGEWLDHRLRSTFALYDMEWKDIQMQSQLPNGTFATVNPGSARVQGAELELTYAPIHELVLSAALAYTSPKLRTIDPGVTVAIGASKGDRLPYTPKFAGSLMADYHQPLAADRELSYGLTFRHQGSKISGFPAADANPGVMIPSYDTIDLRLGFGWAKRYEIQARVANVTDEHGYNSVVNWRLGSFQDVPGWAALIPPRTYSLGISANF